MKTTFTLYSDPGHAWLKVPFTSLTPLSLTLEDFSSCSYLKKGHIYLEEDDDMPKFVNALPFTPRAVARHANNRSRIRDYHPNTPDARAYALIGEI